MTESWQNLTNMAESAARGGRYDEAKEAYQRALTDAESRGDAKDAYYTQCNFASLLRLLDQYEEAEQLLKAATQLRYSHANLLAREPVSPLTDLERILAKQNRLQELEAIFTTDTQNMFTAYGRDSFECKMSMMSLAMIYGKHIKDINKSRSIFNEVIAWANAQDGVTRKMIYTNYDGILRGAGLAAEADALMQQLELVKSQSPA